MRLPCWALLTLTVIRPASNLCLPRSIQPSSLSAARWPVNRLPRLRHQGGSGTRSLTMGRDALYVGAVPASSGKLRLPGGSGADGLYYELRGPVDAQERIVLLMGSFGTMAWLCQIADSLATAGFQVLTFDYRHVGSSALAFPPAGVVTDYHTTELFARDAWALVDHVWGPDATCHVYGVSMGGMVAQKMALQDLYASASTRRPPRVRSLYLCVSSRGVTLPVITSMMKTVMPLLSRTGLLRSTVSRLLFFRGPEGTVKRLVSMGFSESYLQLVHAQANETMEVVWTREWIKNAKVWSTFHDPDACASHAWSLTTHELSDAEALLLRNSGIPITSQIALHDQIVPTPRQFALAEAVGGKVILVEGGHMCDAPDPKVVMDQVVAHFRSASVGEMVTNTAVVVETEARDVQSEAM